MGPDESTEIRMQTGTTHAAGCTQVIPDFPKRIYKPSGGWRALLLCSGSLRPRPDAPKPRQEIRMTSGAQPNDC